MFFFSYDSLTSVLSAGSCLRNLIPSHAVKSMIFMFESRAWEVLNFISPDPFLICDHRSFNQLNASPFESLALKQRQICKLLVFKKIPRYY